MITKQSIFKEFDIAKQKDIAKSKQPEPREEVFTNRLAVLQSHKDAKKSNPNAYMNIDIDFDNLIKAYSSASPLDAFYKVVFNQTYDEYLFQKQLENQKDEAEEKYSAIN